MSIEEVRKLVGQRVMSRFYDGDKLVDSTGYIHGPYTLKQVTKGGIVILDTKYGEVRTRPGLIYKL